MKAAIYKTTDGRIDRIFDGPAYLVARQCREGEDYYEGFEQGATHIINGQPTTITNEPTTSELLTEIRRKRNKSLDACDKTMLEDSTYNKPAWKKYRKALRDFPSTCNPHNPIWPVPPEAL